MAEQYNFGDVIEELMEIKSAVAVVASQLEKLPCKENMEKIGKANEELIKINERFVSEDRLEVKYDRNEKRKADHDARLFEKAKFLISPVISSALTLVVYFLLERYIKR
jgi:hypothetical protein